MVALNEYLVVDPKDAQLMTLATKLHQLKEAAKSDNATNGGEGNGGGSGGGA